jgi:glycosyltransferase involved in cell wall biosynthesis
MDDHPRVGLDALFLEQPMTGSGRYALNLWRQLRARLPASRLRLLAPADTPPFVAAEGADQLVQSNMPPLGGRARKLWWEQVGLPRAVRACDLDLVHIPYFAAPAVKSLPYVVTVHDLIPMAVPAYHGSLAMRAYLQIVARTVRGAALVLTDSEFSKRDIECKLGIPRNRIRVIPLAADEQFSPATSEDDCAAIDAVRQRFGLTCPFVLNTGGLDARKQVPEVIEGFASALSGMTAPHDLVIVGRAHTGNRRMYPPLDPIIRRYGLQGRVHLVGAVGDDEFVALYRAAELFIFASAYEGFGLTPLEAMACGAPVICSRRSSLPEVVGEAGLLIEPEAREIAGAILSLLGDAGLRADLAARGIERSREFTWARTAGMTLDAYSEALRMTGGGG